MIREGEQTPAVDFLFFGLIKGHEAELGYFSLVRGNCQLSGIDPLSPAVCHSSRVA
jgi:hypothetical protein